LILQYAKLEQVAKKAIRSYTFLIFSVEPAISSLSHPAAARISRLPYLRNNVDSISGLLPRFKLVRAIPRAACRDLLIYSK
jgi:hypothetical protein